MTGEQRPERAPSGVERPSDIIHVTAACGLDWTGPRRAWDVWFSDRHAWAHNKGRDGLSASCSGKAITIVEPGPSTRSGRHRRAGPRRGPVPHDLRGRNLVYADTTVMTVCPILILSPFISRWAA